jgi:hypothetical protein
MSDWFFPTESLAGDGGGTALSGLDAAAFGEAAGELGIDIASLGDLDPQLRLIGGRAVLAQDLLHRLETPAGGLFDDDSYGYDLRALLCAALDERDAPRIAAAVEAQCLLDERVLSVRAAVTLYRAESRLRVAVAVETAEGPFAFVVGVTDVTLELLETR